jgi:hypothetical protein
LRVLLGEIDVDRLRVAGLDTRVQAHRTIVLSFEQWGK